MLVKKETHFKGKQQLVDVMLMLMPMVGSEQVVADLW